MPWIPAAQHNIDIMHACINTKLLFPLIQAIYKGGGSPVEFIIIMNVGVHYVGLAILATQRPFKTGAHLIELLWL